MNRSDQILGCLMGGMLGDAIGSHYEGSAPSQFSIPSDLRITDDTQLTLATCESIIEVKQVSPESIAAHFTKWFRERRITGIGSSTLKALVELDAGGHWAMVGSSGERAAGNGAAMRIAPLAFFLNADVSGHRQIIRDVCNITHRNDEAYIGAMAILRAIRYAASEKVLDYSLFQILIESLPDSKVRDRLNFVRETHCSVAEYGREYNSTGYVVDSVPLAILAAIQEAHFIETLESLIMLGGDTDTVGSMFGQIYGTAYGCRYLPLEIADCVEEFETLIATSKELANIDVF
jgi:ADP-ribosylglycohydrolase